MEDLKIKNNIEHKEDNYIYLIKSFIYSIIGISIFFIPIKINDQRQTFLYHISDKIQSTSLSYLKICIIICILLGILKSSLEYSKSKQDRQLINIIIKCISLAISVVIYYGNHKIFFLSETTILIVEDIILNLVVVFPISAIFVTFLIDYGLLDIVESYTQGIMKGLFNLSGKTIINIMIYIFTDFFVGSFVTNKLYLEGKLREKEAVILLLNFSVFGNKRLIYIMDEFNINRVELVVLSIIILIISNVILCRVYPISKKKKSYYKKTPYRETIHRKDKFKKAIKKYELNLEKKKLYKRVFTNLEESIHILIDIIPKIILIMCIGDIIINNSYIISTLAYIINPILSFFKVLQESELSNYIVISLFCNISAIESIKTTLNFEIRLLMGIIFLLQSASFTSYISMSSNFGFNIGKKDFLINYIGKIIIVIAVYFTMYYFYMGYIM